MGVDVQALKRLVEESGNIVFFGGAGTSTESGIPDFRSAGGLFSPENGAGGSYAPEEILSHDFFMSRPKEFYQFYFSKMIYRDARPGAAHLALAELERRGKLKAVITQNIDGLHQMAGSKEVLELHGSVHRNYCMHCGRFYDLDGMLELARRNPVPRCESCGGIVRPDVVLYQENLNSEVLWKSQALIAGADVLIVAGTSLRVYPAAGLVEFYRGDKMILINTAPTPYDSRADYVIPDSVGKVMHSLVFS